MFSSKHFLGKAFTYEVCAVLLMGSIGISHGYCPRGWTAHGRKCYGAFMPEGKYRKVSYLLMANCMSLGGIMMSPSTPEQNRIGANLLTTRTPLYCARAIIGLNDRYVEGSFRWGDGTELTWRNWQLYSNPEGLSLSSRFLSLFIANTNIDEEDCVAMGEDGKWQTISCDAETEYNYVTLCEQRMEEKCPSGWTKHGRNCYTGFPATGHEQSVQHMEQMYCLPNNAFLMNPRTEEENRIALQLARSAPSTFRGRAIIGLNDRDSEGSFRWSDGTQLTWSNWYPGQPDNRFNDGWFTTGEDCVQLGGDGKWNDIRCSGVILQRYIILCEMPISDLGRCWLKWTQYGTKCYYGFTPILGEDDVEDMEATYCKSAGGMLMNPKTEAENNLALGLVIDALANGEYMGVIGLGDEGSEGSYRWSDGTYLGDNWTSWLTGQPDNKLILLKGDEDCVSMRMTGTWEDTRCEQDDLYRYITLCEKPAKDKPKPASPLRYSVAQKQSEGLYVVGSPALKTKVHSITFCSRMCEKNPNCDTMNFNPSTGECIGYTNDGNLEWDNIPGWEIWSFVNTLQ